MRGSAVCSFQSALGAHLMNSSAAVPMIDFPRIVRYFVLFVFCFFRPIDFPPSKSLMSTLFSPLLLLIASSLWFPISGTGATKFFGIFLFAFLLWIIAKGSSAVVHKLSSRLLSILFRCCCCSSLFNHLFPTIHMTQLESRAHTLPVLSHSFFPNKQNSLLSGSSVGHAPENLLALSFLLVFDFGCAAEWKLRYVW